MQDYKDQAFAPSEAEAGPELRTTVVGIECHGQRLDKVLVSLAPELSRNHLQD